LLAEKDAWCVKVLVAKHHESVRGGHLLSIGASENFASHCFEGY